MKDPRDGRILLQGAGHDVDDHDHDIRRLNSELRLFAHQRLEPLGAGLQPACVDYLEAMAGPLRLVAMSVTRDAGRGFYYGLSAAEDPVDER